MSIPQVYIKGSKKQANEKLANGDTVSGIEFNFFNGDKWWKFADLPDGAVFKFYTKLDGAGTPIARAYGNKKGGKII